MVRSITPSIGILTIPTKYGGVILQLYVDWFKHKGVNIIPIPYDTIEHEKYFNMIHGLLIPGSSHGDNQIISKNDIMIRCISRFIILSLHEYFPIFGICYGFQLLVCAISGITKLTIHHADGLYPIHICNHSRMFSTFSPSFLHSLENSNSTLHNNNFGISVIDFMKNKHLTRFYNIVATGTDDNHKQYVSVIEAKYYPIYGIQWHPERSTKTAGPIADFFISECRVRSRKYNTKCIHDKDIKKEVCYYF